MSANQPYLFVSYASVDHARVLPLTRTLEAAGVRVWRDQEAIPGGSIYGPEIVAGIEGCAALVVMCSAAALSSPNVRQEIALAWKYRRPYLPLLLEPVSIPRDVEYWLEGAQWIEVLERAERVWLPAVVAAITRLDPAVIVSLAPSPLPPLAATLSPSTAPVGSSTHVGDLGQGAAAAPAIRRTLTLLGRDPELAVLRALLEFAEAGQGQLAFVVGEPGIGKTRLTSELVEQAQAAGWRTLWSYCYEWDGAPPYWPWIELLRAALADLDVAALRAALGTGAADLAQLMPEVRQRLPDLPLLPPMEPEQARFRLFESVTSALKALARQQRLLLVLDDLHWADAGSLALLQFVVKALRGAQIVIIGTYRTVEVSQQRPLAAAMSALAREPHATRLLLRGLDEADVGRYVRELAGGEPAASTLATIYRETEGNPFFVGEITRLLLSDGVLLGRDDALTRIRVPESVREVVGKRLEHLSEAGHRLLRIAAVVGRDFSLSILEVIDRQGTDALLDLLDEAIAAQLVEEGTAFGHYRFSHALVQETLYTELSTARRVRLHGQVGEALEQMQAANLTPHLGVVAQHYFQAAAAGYAPKAIDFAVRAAERAMEQVAYEDASDHYQRALQILDTMQPPDDARRAEVLLALGSIQWRRGAVDDGQAAYLQAAQLAGSRRYPEQLARAALGYCGVDVFGSHFVGEHEARLIREALDLLPRGDSILRAKLLAKLTNTMEVLSPRDEAAQRSAVAREAVAMARRLGDPATLALALAELCWTLPGLDQFAELDTCADELVQLGDELGDGIVRATGFFWSSYARFVHGEMDEFDEFTNRCRAWVDESHNAVWRGELHTIDAMRARMRGRYDLVEQFLNEAPTYFGSGGAGDYICLGLLVPIRREQGRLAEPHADLAAALSTSRYSADPLFRCLRALVLWEAQNTSEGRAIFDGFAEDGFASVQRTTSWMRPVLALLGELSVLLADHVRAATLYDLLCPYADRNIGHMPSGFALGSASYYLGLLAGLLGEPDAAQRHFEDALAFNERMGARPFVAQTQHAYADLLVRLGAPGDRDLALELVNQALATAESIGMTRLAEQALALKVRAQGILKA